MLHAILITPNCVNNRNKRVFKQPLFIISKQPLFVNITQSPNNYKYGITHQQD